MELSIAQIAKLQAQANVRVDLLNDTKQRLSVELCEALVRAHDEGADLEGATFDLVLVKKPVPVNKTVAAPTPPVSKPAPKKSK